MKRQNAMMPTPDGKASVGLVQGPQEGGHWSLRISIREAASGKTREFVYDNRLGNVDPSRDAILALNDHQFLVLEGGGVDGVKPADARSNRVWAVDVAGAQDIAGQSQAAALLARAPSKIAFQDVSAALRAFGLLEAEQAGARQTPSTAHAPMTGASEGIQYDAEFLAHGEAYLNQEPVSETGSLDFFTGLELRLPDLGQAARDPAAIPGLGGLVLLALGLAWLRRITLRRPTPARR